MRQQRNITKPNVMVASFSFKLRVAMCAIAFVAPSGSSARMLLERENVSRFNWSPITPLTPVVTASGSALTSAAAGIASEDSAPTSSNWPWEVRWSSVTQPPSSPPPPPMASPTPPSFVASPSPPPPQTSTITTSLSPAPPTQSSWWLKWSSIERSVAPPPPPPPSPPPPSAEAALERMGSLDEVMQMAELLATLLIQENLSSERLTAYTEIAAQAFMNNHQSAALDYFAQNDLQAWLFDQVLALARNEDFRNSARATFASSGPSGDDVHGEDILYAAEALVAYQASAQYDAEPIVTSASFSELTRDLPPPSSLPSLSSSPSASIDEDVRESIARDRLARLASPAAVFADPHLLAAALQPSLLASLLSDPSVLAYLSSTFGASDSIASSLAG